MASIIQRFLRIQLTVQGKKEYNDLVELFAYTIESERGLAGNKLKLFAEGFNMQQMLPERLRAEYQRIIDDYCAGDCSEGPEQYFLSHASDELVSKWKETNTLMEEERASGAMSDQR